VDRIRQGTEASEAAPRAPAKVRLLVAAWRRAGSLACSARPHTGAVGVANGQLVAPLGIASPRRSWKNRRLDDGRPRLMRHSLTEQRGYLCNRRIWRSLAA